MKGKILKIISLLTRLKLKLLSDSKIDIHPTAILHWSLKIKGPGKIIISENCNLWTFEEPNRFFTYTPNATITINKNTRINGATFHAREKITVEPECLIGSTILMDNDFHHANPTLRKDKTNIPTKPINIHKNVWLCGQTVILKGVTIGENSVIGFRSVVFKDIDANKIAIGNPANEIKDLKF